MQHIVPFISAHWPLVVAGIILLALILINEILAQKKRGKTLSTSAAITKINHENAVVIDLRDVETFKSGHIVDSIRANADEFTQKRMDKYKNKPLILVCARGIQSAALATTLRQQGFNEPMALAGGIDAWKAANLPLVKGKKS